VEGEAGVLGAELPPQPASRVAAMAALRTAAVVRVAFICVFLL